MRPAIALAIVSILFVGCERDEPFGGPTTSEKGNNGAFIQLTSTSGNAKSMPIISADGETVAFLSSEDLVPGSNGARLRQVFVTDSAGTDLRQVSSISDDEGVYGFDLSPDGTWVVYWDSFNRVYRASTETAGATLLAVNGTAKISPDGDSIVCSNAYGLFILDKNGITTSYLPLDLHYWDKPGVSSSAGSFVFSSAAELDGTNTDGKLETYLMSGTGETILRLSNNQMDNYYPSISYDGETIVYDDGGKGVTVVNAQGEMLQTFDGYLDIYSGISQSGEYVTFVSDGRVFVGDVATGAASGITPDDGSVFVAREPSISANGSRVAFASQLNLAGDNEDMSFEIFVTR